MKTINVPFTDDEHQKLSEVKGDLNWHDFILEYKRPYDLGRELVMVKAKIVAVRRWLGWIDSGADCKRCEFNTQPCNVICSVADSKLREILGESQKSAPIAKKEVET